MNGEKSVNVILDGTDSYDPEGQPLKYRWKFVAMPDQSAKIAGYLSPEKATFDISRSGRWSVSLTVQDPGGLEDSTTKILNVQQ